MNLKMAEITDESSVDRDLTSLQLASVMGDEEIISNSAAKYQGFVSSLTQGSSPIHFMLIALQQLC